MHECGLIDLKPWVAVLPSLPLSLSTFPPALLPLPSHSLPHHPRPLFHPSPTPSSSPSLPPAGERRECVRIDLPVNGDTNKTTGVCFAEFKTKAQVFKLGPKINDS